MKNENELAEMARAARYALAMLRAAGGVYQAAETDAEEAEDEEALEAAQAALTAAQAASDTAWEAGGHLVEAARVVRVSMARAASSRQS